MEKTTSGLAAATPPMSHDTRTRLGRARAMGFRSYEAQSFR